MMGQVCFLTLALLALVSPISRCEEILEVESGSLHQIVKRQVSSVAEGTVNAEEESSERSSESDQTSQYQPGRQSTGRHYVSPNGRPYYQYRPPISSSRDAAVHEGSITRSQTYSYPFGHRSSQASSRSQSQEVTGEASNSGSGTDQSSGTGSISGHSSRTYQSSSEAGSSWRTQNGPGSNTGAAGGRHPAAESARRHQELRRRLYERQRLRMQESLSGSGNTEGHSSSGAASTSSSSAWSQQGNTQQQRQRTFNSQNNQNPAYTAYSQRRIIPNTRSQQAPRTQHHTGNPGSAYSQRTVSSTVSGSPHPSQSQRSSGSGYYRSSSLPVGQASRTYSSHSPSSQQAVSGYHSQGNQDQGSRASSGGRTRYTYPTYTTQTREQGGSRGQPQQWPHRTRPSQQGGSSRLNAPSARTQGSRSSLGTVTGSFGVEEEDSECPETGIQLRIDGMNCQQAIQRMGSYLCYVHEFTSRDCCQICKARKRPDQVGCEYGDHAALCSSISPADCYDLRNQASCCETCERYRRRDAPEGCEYGDQTPRCDAVRQNPGLCYVPDNQRLCCQTCANMKNQTNPTCPWGDYNDRLCQLFGTDTSDIRINCYSPQRRRICCESCERLRSWMSSDSPPADCPYGDRPVVFSTSHYGRLTCSTIFNYFSTDECTTNQAVATNCCHTCHRLLANRG